MPERIKIITVILLAIFPGMLPGDVREEMAKLRAVFEADLQSSEETEMKLYLTQLENLERTLSSERNYAGALRVRDEAMAIRQALDALASARPTTPENSPEEKQPQRFVFGPEEAITVGVTFEKSSGWLRGWRSPDDVAKWKLPDLEPGGYEVFLEYIAGSSEGGDFIVSETFFRLGGKIESTDGTTVKRNFGTLKVRTGQAYLSLYATRIEIGGLMRLKSIELVPAWR